MRNKVIADALLVALAILAGYALWVWQGKPVLAEGNLEKFFGVGVAGFVALVYSTRGIDHFLELRADSASRVEYQNHMEVE